MMDASTRRSIFARVPSLRAQIQFSCLPGNGQLEKFSTEKNRSDFSRKLNKLTRITSY